VQACGREFPPLEATFREDPGAYPFTRNTSYDVHPTTPSAPFPDLAGEAQGADRRRTTFDPLEPTKEASPCIRRQKSRICRCIAAKIEASRRRANVIGAAAPPESESRSDERRRFVMFGIGIARAAAFNAGILVETADLRA
jgi:hypothetical protein